MSPVRATLNKWRDPRTPPKSLTESNMVGTAVQLNSFQKWAADLAGQFGFAVEPCGNWVTLERGGVRQKVLTYSGVMNACGAAIPQVAGMQVIGTGDRVVFVRLPKQLQRPIVGGCNCHGCAESGNPAMWDTLAVPTDSGRTYLVHMPTAKQ